MIRFVHTADLHLDRPFEGLTKLPNALYQRTAASTFTAFSTLIDTTIHEGADFLIIAGDVFDNSHRSIKAQRYFISEMKRLQVASIPVFLTYGNHDFINKSWNHLKLPDNVHVFPVSPTMIPLHTASGQSVHLYGFSYKQRWISADMSTQYTRTGHADFHIAILHGEQRSGETEGSYAPFTIQGLSEKRFDYWALGHIHKRQQLAFPLPIWYPGDIQGLSFKESELGQKGASIVELDENGAHVRFFSTADVGWDCASLAFSGPITAEALEESMNQLKEEQRERHHGAFIRLSFTFTASGLERYEAEEMVREMIEAINEEEMDQPDFIWFIPGNCSFRTVWDKKQIIDSPHFVGDLFRLIERTENVSLATDLLYQHHSGRRYLAALTQSDLEEIKVESEQLLAEALLSPETDI
jgi:DNA repair exonuclease SbcCD nuclease subunit